MYGYEEHIDLAPEQILQKIPQQKVFEWILKEPFNFKTRYKSPFREHSKGVGTCRFEEREDGTILFVDFGDIITHRSCFNMVQDAYKGVSMHTAIKLICEHFKISTNSSDYEPIKVTESYIKGNNEHASITYNKSPITKREIIYCSQFLIKTDNLFEDSVFPTQKFYIQHPDKPRKTFNLFSLAFAIDFIDAVKIYQPYSKTHRFITNFTQDHIGNIDNLPATGEELVIAKSWKDHRVIRNLLDDKPTIYLHNEGCIPSDYILDNLLSRFKLITIFYDNDATGIRAARDLAYILNMKRIASTRTVHIPLKLGYKDPAETVSKEGRKDTVEIFKNIGL